MAEGAGDSGRVYETNNRRAHISAYILIAGLFLEVVNAVIWFHGAETIAAIVAVLLIVGGVWGEVYFGHRARIAGDKQLAEYQVRAAEADLARAQLEAQLSPRMLNQRQWDLITSFKEQFPEINIAFETDAESRWFAMELKNAFLSAGIKGVMLSRDPAVHSFSIMIFEPLGFDGARPKTVAPLVELFKAEDQLKHGTAVIIDGMPTDLLNQAGDDPTARALLLGTPMVIVGGRFIVPPAHWPKPPKPSQPAAAKTNP